MRAASVIPARRPRALLNSPASTVVLRRMRFIPRVCYSGAKTPAEAGRGKPRSAGRLSCILSAACITR